MDANIFWIVVPSLLIFLLSWVVSSTRSVRVATLEAQLQQGLIAKIASHADLQAYLESQSGQRSLRSDASPSEKALESVRVGVLLAVSGSSMIAWSLFDSRVPLGIGLITVALGAGSIAAGAATRYLAQRWNLPDRGATAVENLNAR
jgi:hypothetical protein